MEFWKKRKIETFKREYKYLTEFTQEELIYEKVKCAIDSTYVIETYFYIFDQTKNNGKGEIIPFILFPFQKDLIASYEKNRFNITNKYRQAGISTVTCAWLASYIAFNSNRSVAIVANKLETARDELMKDVTDFIDMLPPFLHPQISGKDAANHKRYLNGSQVKAFATNSLRGYTPTFLFWDEAAWCDNGEMFWTGTLPTLSTGGNAALVSCVVGDTAVWTNKGLEKIEEIVDKKQTKGYKTKKYLVLGKEKLREGNIMFNNGFNKTKIIKNEYTDIECTLNHKLWGYSNINGHVDYIKASSFKTGDYVTLQFGMEIFGNIDEIRYIPKYNNGFDYFNYLINNEIIDIVSIFLQKGVLIKIPTSNDVDQHVLEFKNLNDEQYNIIIKFIKSFRKKNNTLFISEDKKEIKCSIQMLNNILFNMGLYYEEKYDTITNRTIPKLLRRLKKEYIVRLIKKWIYFYDKKEINEKSFLIKHRSIILLKQFQQILLNYGILSKITNKTLDDKINLLNIYVLTVECDYNKFIYDETYKPINNQLIPMGIVEKINNILIKYDIDLPFNNYDRIYLLNIINKLEDILTDNDKSELSKYISPNTYWSIITDIKSNKNITYDFSLSDNEDDNWAHSVIYNGILGHQTPNGLDPVFYKTYNNAKNGTSEFNANELHWYYDPRYSIDLSWKKKNADGNEIIIKETNKNKYKKLLEDGFKPTSPWYEAMASKFNYDKKKIAQELECVTGDTLITIKNNETGLIEKIQIEALYERLGNNKYSVLNNNNEFVIFDGIHRKQVNSTIKIIIDSKTIETTESHILIGLYSEISAINLKINDLIQTENGFEKIIDIININEEKYVYDLINVGIDSLYLTNGIVSHNCSFLGSGNNFIDEENIKRIEDTQIKDPIRMEYDDFFWIWEDPIKDESYVMTVDVSTGASDDYSTIIILKQHETHLEQVAEFKHKVSPDTLGVIANDYGIRYNNAFAIVDITGGIGAMTMKTMLELGYTNVHYTVSRHEPTKEKLTDYVKEDDNGKTLVPGFVISTSNRGMILTEMKRAIESNEVEIKSYRLVSEFKTFISTSNVRVADHRRSFNDDLVIALAMGIYVFSYDIKSVGMSVERTKKMLEAITNTITDNSSGDSMSSNNGYNINPSNPYAAHSWLFRGLNK